MKKYNRDSIRLKGYNYSSKGLYFVTISTQNRRCLFGEIIEKQIYLNDYGNIVQNEWLKTPKIRKNVELDVFIVMPNHFHGVVCIVDDCRDTARRAPTVERFGKPISGSVPTIIRAFKSAVTKHINQCRNTPTAYVWQRNYYEHIIRNEGALDKIRQYIIDNPLNWDNDKENPNNIRLKGKPCTTNTT